MPTPSLLDFLACVYPIELGGKRLVYIVRQGGPCGLRLIPWPNEVSNSGVLLPSLFSYFQKLFPAFILKVIFDAILSYVRVNQISTGCEEEIKHTFFFSLN